MTTKLKSSLLILAAAAGVSFGNFAHAGSTPAAAASPSKEPDLEIYNVTDQDLSPTLRTCLAADTLGNCMAAQLATGEGPVQNPASQGSLSNEQLVNGWKNFLHSSLGNAKIFADHSIAPAFGFTYGMTRVDPEETLLDPNMSATDKQQGGQAVWVVHTMEVAPGIHAGTDPSPLDTVSQSKAYYGGIFQAGGIVRLTKRHPLDQVFTTNFWGEFGEEKEIIKEALPDYVKIPSDLEGSGLLPGEGLQFEGFMLVEIGIGPTYNLGSPAVPYLGTGLFGSAGLVATVTRGHFSTRMEVQTDQTMRVVLERINQDSEKLAAQVNAGFVVGPFNFTKNLINLETGVIHTKETLLDLVFDPKYPEAQHALKEAYLGRFTEAQTLSNLPLPAYKGVKAIAHTSMTQKTSERGASLLSLSKGSSESRSEIDTQFVNPDPSADEGADDQTQMDQSDTHSGTFTKSSDLQITIRNDGDQPNQGQSRSLSVKYTFKASKPSSTEVQQFVDMGKIFGHTPDQTPVVGKPVQGYFFMDLDVDNVKSILSKPAAELTQDFEKAAQQMPGASAHMKEINAFADALAKAVKTEDAIAQDHLLIKTLRGKGFDLYPMGVLSLLVDSSHTLLIERATFTTGTETNGSDLETLEFPSIGSQYVFPSRIEY